MQPHYPIFLTFLPLLIWTLIGIPLAVGNAFLARRLDRSVALWVILSIIPGVNVVFFYYIVYVVVFRVLDRLSEIADRVGKTTRA
jgi:hypothetical protein